MREISEVTYSPDRSHLLRMALGTLSGLIIGWFVFLLPGQSVVSSISPLALAFLVGYNIEIVFNLMDRLIHTITRTDEDDADDSESGEDNKTNGEAEDKKGSAAPA